MRSKMLCVLCLCLLGAYGNAAEAESATLSLPGLEWAVSAKIPGVWVKRVEMNPQGNMARLLGTAQATGVTISSFLEKAPAPGDARACRAHYWAREQKSPIPVSDVKMSEVGDAAIVEYMVKAYMGRKVGQKNIHVYLAHDGYWIDVHISKVLYQPQDQPSLDAIVKSVQIVNDYAPDSALELHFGNAFFRQSNYAQAIPHYEKAMEMEKTKATLPRTWRLVLLDQLGMAYGISGNLDKAKEVYTAAIAEEPEYPMFYYNMACACAESNDLEGTIKNLKKAHAFKNNMIPGEKMPDPRRDSSFRKFMGNQEFLAALKAMQ